MVSKIEVRSKSRGYIRGLILRPWRWFWDHEEQTRRLYVLTFCLLLWGIGIAGRLIYLQVFQHEELRRRAEAQHKTKVEVKAARGTIYDRNHQPLAMSVAGTSIAINPQRIPDVDMAVDSISGAMGMDRNEFANRIRHYRSTKGKQGFLLLRKNADAKELARMEAYAKSYDFISFPKTSIRHYPKGTLAANLLGVVDRSEHGVGGVEQSLDEELEGMNGSVEMLHDVWQHGVASKVNATALAGKDITLSIDQRIQFAAEQILEKHAQKHGCPRGSIVVMRPATGDILAMASYPGFDPNEALPEGEAGKVQLRRRQNQAVSTPFEPGSVFKVITLAAALEHTSLHPDSNIPCGGGVINLFGRRITDLHHFSSLSMTDVLVHSSNIGAINIGLKVTDPVMYDVIRAFGFGRKTGLPLMEESPGRVRPLRRWIKSSIGSVAMGHELMTTTTQLAQACSTVANHGRLVKPRLVLKAERPGLKPEYMAPEAAVTVLSPESAMKLRLMMEQVVQRGTGTNAKVKGYSIGGKTGSAQIYDAEHKKYTNKHNVSFMGFAPVANPEIVIVVTLNGSTLLSSVTAVPAFQEIMSASLRILNIQKDVPFGTPEVIEKKPLTQDDLSIASLGGARELLADDEEDDAAAALRPVAGPVVPNFKGLTKRAVLEQSSAKGLRVEMEGRGIARKQIPAAGKVLAQGESIRVVFAR